MTQENKDLLLKDLCARLPYGVRGKVKADTVVPHNDSETGVHIDTRFRGSALPPPCSAHPSNAPERHPSYVT